jgi:hypothetical protein
MTFTRTFTHNGTAYQVELSGNTYRMMSEQPLHAWEGGLGVALLGESPTTFKPCDDRAALREALNVLATDPYRDLRLTHSRAIDKMIEDLAGRTLPYMTLIAAKQKVGVL